MTGVLHIIQNDPEVPPGNIIDKHQAFRVGDSAWGLQFHPEVTESIIRDWCAWDSSTAARTEEMVSAFAGDGAAYGATARQLLHNFLQSAGFC